MIALIAGTGLLPAVLTEHLRGQAKPFTVCALQGNLPTLSADLSPRVFRLEHLGSLIADLHAEGVRSVCFAGAITRPQIDPTQIDARTRPLIEQIAGALRAGDDGALRVVLGVFEQHGFTVASVQELMPSLVPSAGVLSQRKPDDQDGADAGRAAGVLAAMGRSDIGQSCVVSGGQVLALEALPGTDWMLRSLAELPSHRIPAAGARGRGVFYKAPKPGQDRRADLPVVGPDTLQACARAGLRGLVIEEGGVIVLEQARVIEWADAANMFVWVRPSEEAQP